MLRDCVEWGWRHVNIIETDIFHLEKLWYICIFSIKIPHTQAIICTRIHAETHMETIANMKIFVYAYALRNLAQWRTLTLRRVRLSTLLKLQEPESLNNFWWFCKARIWEKLKCKKKKRINKLKLRKTKRARKIAHAYINKKKLSQTVNEFSYKRVQRHLHANLLTTISTTNQLPLLAYA